MTKKNLITASLVCACLVSMTTTQAAVTLPQANGTENPHSTVSARNFATIQQQYINDMGVKILNANGIDKHIIFEMDAPAAFALPTASIWGVKDDVTNSKRYLFNNRKVLVQDTLLRNATSDDEVAALVSHEIAHCLKSYTGILRGSLHALVYTFTAKRQNSEADLKAVDMMVKAGYNPVGLITILDKTAGQYRFDIGENTLTTKRIRKINDYIKANYPKYISAYASNPYYKNALLIIAPAEEEKNLGSMMKKKSKTTEEPVEETK